MATLKAPGKSAKPTGTSIAALAWGDHAQMVVYWQDHEGWIRSSSTTDGYSWSGGSKDSRLIRAKLGTPLAAVSWGEKCGHVRLYYLNDSNTLQEYCYDGKWYSGGLNARGIKVDPHSKLAASCWSDDPHINVYYQLPTTGYIQELRWVGGWREGATLRLDAALGTALTVAPFGFRDVVVLRLFYQGKDNRIHEHMWDSEEWKRNEASLEAIKGTGIAAISVKWSSKNSETPLRLYFEKARDMDKEYCGGLVESIYTASTRKWSEPKILSPTVTNAPLAACAYGDQYIRIFIHPTTPGFESTSTHDLHEYRVHPTYSELARVLPTF